VNDLVFSEVHRRSSEWHYIEYFRVGGRVAKVGHGGEHGGGSKTVRRGVLGAHVYWRSKALGICAEMSRTVG
jgi:hypothetical protein